MVSQVSYLTWFPNIRCLIFCATRGGFSKRGKAGAKVKLQLAEPCGHAPGFPGPNNKPDRSSNHQFFRGEL